MRAFEITAGGEKYLVTERNTRSGLYELRCSRDGSIHVVGRSSKREGWLYIQKSPFTPSLCPNAIESVLTQFMAVKGQSCMSV